MLDLLMAYYRTKPKNIRSKSSTYHMDFEQHKARPDRARYVGLRSWMEGRSMRAGTREGRCGRWAGVLAWGRCRDLPSPQTHHGSCWRKARRRHGSRARSDDCGDAPTRACVACEDPRLENNGNHDNNTCLAI